MSGEPLWGRLAVAGGVDWPTVGRASRSPNEQREDQVAPALVRSCLTHKFKRVYTSSSSVHAVLIDVNDKPWLVGRNEHFACGSAQDAVWEPTPLSDGEVFPKTPQALVQDTVVHAATGRHHTILVTASGDAYVAGQNHLGQAATENGLRDVPCFNKVNINGDKVVSASAGVSFSLFLTDKGQVWAVGGAEKGQLGHGRTGETIANSRVIIQDEPRPLLVKGLENKHIVAIASGHQHSLAMDKEGYVWSWGHGGFGRLGHGEQKDCLAPRLVDAFTGDQRILRASKIACGANCSIVVDGQGMMQLFGKFKVTGDGSAGQPWMTPRPFQELASYKIKLIAGGATTIFAVTGDDEDHNLVGLGQGTNHGELGLGRDKNKSASKMQPIETMNGVDILDMASGQNTTWFLSRPPATSEEKAIGAAIAESRAAAKKKKAGDGYDSGWNFTMPTPAADPAASEAGAGAASEESKPDEEVPEATNKPETQKQPSRTTQDAWDSLARFPEVPDQPPSPDCYVCNKPDENDEVPSVLCDRCEKTIHLACLDSDAKEPPEGEVFCKICLGEVAPEQPPSKKRKASGAAASTKKSRK